MAGDVDADRGRLQAAYDAAQAGNHDRAIDLATAALADGLEYPLFLNLAALQQERDGNYRDAERLLQRAVQLAPQDPTSRNALGLCLLRLEQPRDALLQFDALLAIDSSLAFAHVSRGDALHALRRVSQAEQAYRRALDLEPAQPIALARLANIAASRGLYPEARLRAEKALLLLPGYPDAILSLAAAELGDGRGQQAEALIRTLLTDPRLGTLDRAHAEGQLGDVLDAADRPAEAFAAYSSCNDELRRVHRARFAAGENAFDYVSAMSEYFARVESSAWSARRSPSPTMVGADQRPREHIFILGFPRSGTTLLEVILEGHPEVVSLEEDELFIDAVQEFMRRPEDLRHLERADTATLDRFRLAYWRRVSAAGVAVQGRVFVDKYPLNSLKILLIARLFPRAKIIFACRDPRDTVLSCFRHRFRLSAPLYELLSLEGGARYYDAVMRLLLQVVSRLSLDVCLVRHEDVVTEFMREMKRVCAFLQLEWFPAMGDFALRAQYRAVLTPSAAQLVRGLNTEGVGHWRRYRDELAAVMPVLQPWIERFYYEP